MMQQIVYLCIDGRQSPVVHSDFALDVLVRLSRDKVDTQIS